MTKRGIEPPRGNPPHDPESCASTNSATSARSLSSLRVVLRVRRKNAPPHTATFTRLSEARKWAQMVEGAITEGRHFPLTKAKRHTLADLADRYLREVLPQKSASSIAMQTQQLLWWETRLGHCILKGCLRRCCRTRWHRGLPLSRFAALGSELPS